MRNFELLFGVFISLYGCCSVNAVKTPLDKPWDPQVDECVGIQCIPIHHKKNASDLDNKQLAHLLHQVMNSSDALLSTVCKSLTKLTLEERLKLVDDYRIAYKEDLVDLLDVRLSGTVRHFIVGLLLPLPEYYAKEINKAIYGLNFYGSLIEILGSLSNQGMKEVYETYRKAYGKPLRKVISSLSTEGSDFKQCCLSLTLHNRAGHHTAIDEEEVENDAFRLISSHESGEPDAPLFRYVLVHRSFPHIVKVFQRMHTNIEYMTTGFDYAFKKAADSLIVIAKNRHRFFAERLIKDLNKGRFNTYKILMRIIISRSDIDLGSIINYYEKKTGTRFKDDVQNAKGLSSTVKQALKVFLQDGPMHIEQSPEPSEPEIFEQPLLLEPAEPPVQLDPVEPPPLALDEPMQPEDASIGGEEEPKVVDTVDGNSESDEVQVTPPPESESPVVPEEPVPPPPTDEAGLPEGEIQGEQAGSPKISAPGSPAPGSQKRTSAPGSPAVVSHKGTSAPGSPAPGSHKGGSAPGSPAPGSHKSSAPGTPVQGSPKAPAPGTEVPGSPPPGSHKSSAPGSPAPGSHKGTSAPGSPAQGSHKGTPAPGSPAPGSHKSSAPGSPAQGSHKGTSAPGSPAPGSHKSSTPGSPALAPGSHKSSAPGSPALGSPRAPAPGSLGELEIPQDISDPAQEVVGESSGRQISPQGVGSPKLSESQRTFNENASRQPVEKKVRKHNRLIKLKITEEKVGPRTGTTKKLTTRYALQVPDVSSSESD